VCLGIAALRVASKIFVDERVARLEAHIEHIMASGFLWLAERIGP
jgi:hypothetical protein